ncbi:MAG: SoxR reducing system RseC family protein [Muribaculaceae bacterium]|nr:SoxR reducing system RseC family protein [Muribaculaceae bacterium]
MRETTIVHKGVIVGYDNDVLRVKIEPADSPDACSACALAFSCKGSGKDTLIVETALEKPSKAANTLGRKVLVAPKEKSVLKATLLLFIVPLISFMVVAIFGTMIGIAQGVVGLASIGSALLAYFSIYQWQRRHRKTEWHIIATE